jgi:hypothetical protein
MRILFHQTLLSTVDIHHHRRPDLALALILSSYLYELNDRPKRRSPALIDRPRERSHSVRNSIHQFSLQHEFYKIQNGRKNLQKKTNKITGRTIISKEKYGVIIVSINNRFQLIRPVYVLMCTLIMTTKMNFSEVLHIWIVTKLLFHSLKKKLFSRWGGEQL